MDRSTRSILLAFIPAMAVVACAMTPHEMADVVALAEAGNDGAQFMLALIYLRGAGGLAANFKCAVRLLRRAASGGNGYAAAVLQEWRSRRRTTVIA